MDKCLSLKVKLKELKIQKDGIEQEGKRLMKELGIDIYCLIYDDLILHDFIKFILIWCWFGYSELRGNNQVTLTVLW